MIPSISQYDGLQITFNTTEACNLACTYCYEINKTPRTLPYEYAKRFINIILTDPDPIGVRGSKQAWILDNGLILDFIGGDSFTNPQLMDKIISYFIYKSTTLNHKWKNRWRISISTNGTLFDNPGVKDFIYKYRNNLSMGVSVDGCYEIHDKYRKFPDGSGSMEKILKNWDWYKNIVGENNLTTKSTCSKDSIPYLFKSLKFMHEDLGIRYINQNFIFEDMQLSQEDLNEYDKQMELCVEYVLQHKYDLYWSMIEENSSKAVSFCENCKSRPNTGWCGSGAMPALSIDGIIYPCFRWLPHTQKEKNEINVGNVFEGLTHKENFQLIRNQTREKISPEMCKSCEVESMCAWCIAGCYSEKGKFERQTHVCEITKRRIKWSKIYWNKYYEIRKHESLN